MCVCVGGGGSSVQFFFAGGLRGDIWVVRAKDGTIREGSNCINFLSTKYYKKQLGRRQMSTLGNFYKATSLRPWNRTTQILKSWKATKEYLNQRGTKIRVFECFFRAPFLPHPFPLIFTPLSPSGPVHSPSTSPLFTSPFFPFFDSQKNSDLGTPLI